MDNSNAHETKDIDELRKNNSFPENSTKDEQKTFIYYSGIKAINEKMIKDIEDTIKTKVSGEIDSLIFTELFYLIVVLTNSNKDIRNGILKCKENELEENGKTVNEINDYIDMFNKNFKMLSLIFLDINKKAGQDDGKFQDEIIQEFSTILFNSIESKEENDNEMQEVLVKIKNYILKAIMLGFEFR